MNAVTGQVITNNTVENASLRAPLQGVDTVAFSLNESTAQSTYHSLQTTFKRRIVSRVAALDVVYVFTVD